MTATHDRTEPTTYEAAQLDGARTIHARIIAILAALPAIGKDQRNQQQGFMYRGHDDVLNALNPLLAEHGVFIAPKVLKRIENTRTTKQGTTMYEVNLCVLYTFYGAGGDYIEASAWGEGTDSGDKSTNKAMTMAFKNVLAQVFAVSTAELSDADATTPEPTTRGSTPRPERGSRADTKFDPGKSLLPGAILVKTQEDADALIRGLIEIDPLRPWEAIQDYVCGAVFSCARADLSIAQNAEWWRRLANVVVKIQELAGPGDFPPATRGQIEEGFAWAFNGVVLLLDDLDDEPTESEQDAAQEAYEAAEREE